ncbi:sensor domain-containing diguanylate cyclase [Jeongeupia wiesaeckerbachi]|uniref:sensor domain-containing diguanylate cyclase n=1 Tax=Jeongeupia wiesaeckerbachi TaxID=3051218 RepID=UPI003D80051F
MDTMLLALSDTVTEAHDLESLTRPLLEMLETLTGLESTYLTVIDLPRGQQEILFARNADALTIPEGLSVDWNDTLCKRALDEGRMYTGNVADCWGDSDAARALGIRTYLSTPVRMRSGELYGTLCAASAAPKTLNAGTDRVLTLFARLIAEHVEREQLLQQLQRANRELSLQALTDPLTGLPNRRALMQELGRLFSLSSRAAHRVLIAYIDLDGFKHINDTLGHDAGDLLLQTIARRVSSVLRAGDFLARVGGDEFVAIGMGPTDDTLPAHAAEMFQQRLFAQTVTYFDTDGSEQRYPGASVGAVAVDPAGIDVHQALQQADAVMYAVKAQRRAARRA